MANRLQDKVALVTGAASGIGESISRRFIAEGAHVLAVDISGREETLACELGERCIPVNADVSTVEGVKTMIECGISRFGKIDVLCNNAGTEGALTPLAEYELDEFERIMALNVRGVFLGMKYVIPHMLSSGSGSIINIASAAGIVAFPGMVAYSASKGAVRMMSKTAAAEYSAQGIRVNAICPGVVATPLINNIPAEIVAEATSRHPIGRIAEPREIADTAVFLASDESSFITGSDMVVDGGMTAL